MEEAGHCEGLKKHNSAMPPLQTDSLLSTFNLHCVYHVPTFLKDHRAKQVFFFLCVCVCRYVMYVWVLIVRGVWVWIGQSVYFTSFRLSVKSGRNQTSNYLCLVSSDSTQTDGCC